MVGKSFLNSLFFLPENLDSGIYSPSRSLLLLSVACLFVITSVAAAEVKNTFDTTFHEFVTKQLDDKDIPALSMMVVTRGGVLFERSYGYADTEEEAPANSNTLYRIGELSSLFVTTAIMQLVDENKISLDEPVQRYLPEFKVKQRADTVGKITVRSLLNHHSGLPNTRLKSMWSIAQTENWRDVISRLGGSYASFAPGTVYAYSVEAMNLLALLVERVSGQSVQDYLTSRVLRPLSMRDTTYLAHGTDRRLAKGYREGDEQAWFQPRDVPVVGMTSSAQDMARFVTMLLKEGSSGTERVLSASSVREMLSVQNADIVLDIDRKVGLGWQLSGSGLKGVDEVASLYGSALFYTASVSLSSRHGVGIVLLSNSAGAYRSMEAINREALARAIEAQTGTRPQTIDNVQGEIPPPPGVVSGMAREYATFVGLARVTPRASDANVDVLGWSFRLAPQAAGWYDMHYDVLGLIPLDFDWVDKVRVAPVILENRELVVSWHKGQRYLFGVKLPPTPISAAWRARTGRYRLLNPDAMTERMEVQEGDLIEDGGRLLFVYRFPGFMPLTLKVVLAPYNDNEAVIPGLGTFMNETVSVQKRGPKEWIEFSGYQWQRVEQSDSWF